MNRSTHSQGEARPVRVPAGSVKLEATLSLSKDASGIVLFATVVGVVDTVCEIVT